MAEPEKDYVPTIRHFMFVANGKLNSVGVRCTQMVG